MFAALERLASEPRREREHDLKVIAASYGSRSRGVGIQYAADVMRRGEPEGARDLIGRVLDDLVKPPNVRVRVLRDSRAPGGLRIEIAPTCLVGGLAVALLRRIQRVEPARRPCAACGRLVVPERRHPTRRTWCADCRGTRAQARILEGESRERRRVRRRR